MSDSRVVFASRIAVLDHAGERIGWVDPAEAEQLVRKAAGVLCGTRRKVRAVRLIARDTKEYRTSAGMRGRHYSHNRETAYNPHGVWTLVRIPASCAELFSTVLDECRAA